MVKMDLDYDEWGVLEAMLDNGELPLVKQLLLHVHTHETKNKTTSDDDLKRYIKILTRLEDSGFRKWRSYADKERSVVSAESGMRRSLVYQLNYVNSKHWWIN